MRDEAYLLGEYYLERLDSKSPPTAFKEHSQVLPAKNCKNISEHNSIGFFAAGAFGGTSSLGAGSGVVAGLESPRDETVSSPPRAPSPPSSQELWTGASPPAKQKGAKAKKPASAKPPKAMRCGQCYTCKNKQLKKVGYE